MRFLQRGGDEYFCRLVGATLHRENDFSLISLFYKRTCIMQLRNQNDQFSKNINKVYPCYNMVTVMTNLFNTPALR